MKLKFYISVFISLLTLSVFAQDASFTAVVSKDKLGINQRLRIDFSINKQGADNFRPPNFENFKVVSGQIQSINQTWVNGKISFSQSYSYIIQPIKKGELTIGSASIEINGKTLKSNPIKITVSNEIEVPKDPNDPDYIASQNIHLVAEVSKLQPYVGEAIYLEYRLYFSENVGIYDNAITEMPQYNGFWNQEIKITDMPIKIGEYNGKRYRYAVLHKALLIPTKSGKLTIDPMKMDIIVAVPTERGDFFGNAITRKVRQEFASVTRTITPKELPIEGKPENFTGAVGVFNFDVSLSKNALKANESSQIKATVSGKGNLSLFTVPKIITPKELEVYEPERKESVKTTTTGLNGSVAEWYTVVPQYKGKYKIPSSSFSYFNPNDKKYHTITTDDLYVEVLEGKELPTNQNTTTPAQQNVVTTGNDFRYIQTNTSFNPIKGNTFFGSNLFYILLFLPIAIIPIVILITKKNEERNKDIIGNKQRKADRLAKKYLSEAQKQLGKKEAFYEALERALHNYLKAKLGIETSEISTDKITEILEDKKVDNTTINQFINVLKDCNFARYTPINSTQMKSEYENAKQIITQLDKQLN